MPRPTLYLVHEQTENFGVFHDQSEKVIWDSLSLI